MESLTKIVYILVVNIRLMNRLKSAVVLLGLSILLVQCTAKKTATNTMTDEQVVASVKKQYTGRANAGR